MINHPNRSEKSRHTPGPWAAEPIAQAYACFEIGASGRGRLAVTRAPLEGTDAEITANAFLIAAAPDLLVAAKEVLKWAKANRIHGMYHEPACIDMCEAAISKAEG